MLVSKLPNTVFKLLNTVAKLPNTAAKLLNTVASEACLLLCYCCKAIMLVGSTTDTVYCSMPGMFGAPAPPLLVLERYHTNKWLAIGLTRCRMLSNVVHAM